VTAADETSTAPRDVVAQALREDILSGRLAPGDRLREVDLAEQFHVSRVPVREALSQLQNEGFVTLVRYRGATVSDLSGPAALELVQIRRGLEVLAAELAAQQRGGAVADELTCIVELGRSAHIGAADDELPSGNRQLAQMIEQILERVSWIFGRQLRARTEESWSDHAAIALAILNGSPVQAGYLMGEHIAKDESPLRN
jgi:DNA-binding GntR family transcriptional regulator